MRRTMLLAAALWALGCVAEPDHGQNVDDIHEGGEVQSTTDGVGYWGESCTAIEIGDRCLLTAAHCGGGVGTRYHQGARPLSQHTWRFAWAQRVVQSVVPDSPYSDVQLVWLTPFACEMDGYYADELCRAGQTQKVLPKGTLTLKTTPLKLNPLSMVTSGAPEPGDVMHIIGYGNDSFDKSAKKERGSGTKREGTVKVHRVTSFTIEVKRGPHIGCFGDSGGPLLDSDGKVYGVYSRVSSPGGCSLEDPTGTYTRLTGNGNDDFVTSIKDRVCRPRVKDVTVVVADQALGSVTAEHRDPLSQHNKHKVLTTCGAGEGPATCEYVSPDDGTGWMLKAEQGVVHLTLKAVPNTGYTFAGWRAAGDRTCPCEPSKAECIIDASKVSWEAENDGVTCEATFE